MSYPYISDVLNQVFGTQWNIPIAMFGSFVALAIIISSYVAKREVIRFETLGILPKARLLTHEVPTHELISNLAMISAIFGILGARIFHILEYPGEFMSSPFGMIFSRGGFSIFGGLIFGVIAGVVYLKNRSVPIVPMLDALAPAMILGYGIGRVGCQVSGDGDWGILSNMPLKPSFIPDWFWAQTYENNVVGVVIQTPGVYPTPLYEALTAFCIFAFLWSIRKNHYSKGYLFSVYLLLSGFSRLLIEKIRINSEYHLWGGSFTQAEFISTVLIIFGLLGLLKTTRSKYMPKLAFTLLVFSALTACAKL